jgi:hypothetical protein
VRVMPKGQGGKSRSKRGSFKGSLINAAKPIQLQALARLSSASDKRVNRTDAHPGMSAFP